MQLNSLAIPASSASFSPSTSNLHRTCQRWPAERERNRLLAVWHQAPQEEATAPVLSSVFSSATAAAFMSAKYSAHTISVASTMSAVTVAFSTSRETEVSKDST